MTRLIAACRPLAILPSPDGRPRFARRAPEDVDSPVKPLRTRLAGMDLLLRRVEDERARSQEILALELPAEYKEAAEYRRGILEEHR